MKYFHPLSLLLLSSSGLAFHLPQAQRRLAPLRSAAVEGDASNTIKIAFTGGEQVDALRDTLSSHPLMSMLDISAEFVDVECSTEEKDVTAFDEKVDSLDIACFGTPEEVKSWLDTLDQTIDGAQGMTEEERRGLGNGNVVAACIGSETARVCLETGRWDSYSIYYPKGEDDLEGWAGAAAQASADLMEKRFWE